MHVIAASDAAVVDISAFSTIVAACLLLLVAGLFLPAAFLLLPMHVIINT